MAAQYGTFTCFFLHVVGAVSSGIMIISFEKKEQAVLPFTNVLSTSFGKMLFAWRFILNEKR